jgi:hypothetical protein
MTFCDFSQVNGIIINKKKYAAQRCHAQEKRKKNSLVCIVELNKYGIFRVRVRVPTSRVRVRVPTS